jgi:hypothetical protein
MNVVNSQNVQSVFQRIPGVKLSLNPHSNQGEVFSLTMGNPDEAALLGRVFRPQSPAGAVKITSTGMNIMAPIVSSKNVAHFLQNTFGVAVSIANVPGGGQALQIANANPDTKQLMQTIVRDSIHVDDGLAGQRGTDLAVHYDDAAGLVGPPLGSPVPAGAEPLISSNEPFRDINRAHGGDI